ncbi:MAG: type II toxin-antitoxin system HicB family antitoxin [Waterburya sp.]
MKIWRYPIIIEKADSNYCAYSPDVPGCVATGQTIEEVKQEFADALQFHLEGLAEDNDPIPLPKSYFDYIELTLDI